MVLSLKPGIGLNMTLHASLIAKNPTILISAFASHLVTGNSVYTGLGYVRQTAGYSPTLDLLHAGILGCVAYTAKVS